MGEIPKDFGPFTMDFVTIPFADLEKVFPASEAKPKPIQMVSSGGSRPRVLIAEDDPLYSLGLFERLVLAGYEVVVAVTGTDAIAELRKADHPPVAILAATLPGMNAAEICERMRDAGKDVYLILLSPAPTTQDVISGLEIGADEVFSKSILLEELVAHVRVGVRIISRMRSLLQRLEGTGGDPLARAS